MPADHEPRIPPLPPTEWSAEAKQALDLMRPPPGSIYERRREERGGTGGVNAFALLVRYPELANAFMGFNRHLLYLSALDERTRELVVLRVAHRIRSTYEWCQHVLTARTVGMSDDEIERVAAGPDADGWSDRDRALLRAVDGLLVDGDIDDRTWTTLADHLGERAIFDLVFTIGGYLTVGMLFNAARLPLDPDLEGIEPPWPA